MGRKNIIGESSGSVFQLQCLIWFFCTVRSQFSLHVDLNCLCCLVVSWHWKVVWKIFTVGLFTYKILQKQVRMMVTWAAYFLIFWTETKSFVSVNWPGSMQTTMWSRGGLLNILYWCGERNWPALQSILVVIYLQIKRAANPITVKYVYIVLHITIYSTCKGIRREYDNIQYILTVSQDLKVQSHVYSWKQLT